MHNFAIYRYYIKESIPYFQQLKMHLRTSNLLVKKMIAPRICSSSRARMSTGNFSLEFQPVEDFQDPLDETARSAYAKSCYLKIDWKISENATVRDAINRMVAHKIGALAVTKGDGDEGEIIGIISERDYLSKVGFLDRTSKGTKVGEIATMGKANLVSVTLDNPIDACMKKMLASNVRHLLIREKATGLMKGMISVKDIIKCTMEKHQAVVDKLTGMAVLSEAMRKDY